MREENTSVEIRKEVLNYSFLDNNSFFGGKIGQAFYFNFLGNSLKEVSLKEKSNVLFSEILGYYNENTPKSNSFFTYCSGLSGLGVVLNYLVENKLLDFDIANFNEELQPILFEKASYDLNKKFNYDFLHGAIGIGFYLLETDNEHLYVPKIIEFLDSIKIEDDSDSIYWREYHKEEKRNQKEEVINFSLSHGMSSILIFFCRAYEKGVSQEKCEELAKKCSNFIMKHQLDINTSKHYFPNILVNKKAIGGQEAWCYGELGTSFALKKYSNVFFDEKVESLVKTIFLHNAKKRGGEISRTIDAAICHGSTGLLMMYNRLYKMYGDIEFKNACEYWYQVSIDFSKYKDGVAGYMAYNGYSKKYDKKSYGLLEGAIGIDLMLTTYKYNLDQSWDKLFLIS